MSEPKPALSPPLGDMSKEDFRRFGHELIDWIADYLEHVEDLPVLAQIEPGDLKAQLPSAPPEKGEAMEEIIADVDRLIVPALTHWSHPSFFAYFATSTSAPGIFGELLSAAFDNKAMLWRTSPASTELEEVTLDWLRQMMGLDAGYDRNNLRHGFGLQHARDCRRARRRGAAHSRRGNERAQRSAAAARLHFRAGAFIDRERCDNSRPGPTRIAQDSHGRRVSHGRKSARRSD